MGATAKYFHGTTRRRAQEIVQAGFATRGTFFVLGENNMEIAVEFARRAHQDNPRDGGPALVTLELDGDTEDLLRSRGLLSMGGFDADDPIGMHGRHQWKLHAAGIQIAVRDAEYFDWAPV